MATMTNTSPSIEGELLEKTKKKHGHVVDEEETGKIITNPTEKDILLGRSSMAKRHAGNLFYRDLVEKNQAIYCSHRKRNAKAKITNSIVKSVKDTGGRFLTQDNAQGRVMNYWVEISEQKAFDKVSQALREGQPEIRKKLRHHLGTVTSVAGPPSALYAASVANGNDGRILMVDPRHPVPYPYSMAMVAGVGPGMPNGMAMGMGVPMGGVVMGTSPGNYGGYYPLAMNPNPTSGQDSGADGTNDDKPPTPNNQESQEVKTGQVDNNKDGTKPGSADAKPKSPQNEKTSTTPSSSTLTSPGVNSRYSHAPLSQPPYGVPYHHPQSAYYPPHPFPYEEYHYPPYATSTRTAPPHQHPNAIAFHDLDATNRLLNSSNLNSVDLLELSRSAKRQRRARARRGESDDGEVTVLSPDRADSASPKASNPNEKSADDSAKIPPPARPNVIPHSSQMNPYHNLQTPPRPPYPSMPMGMIGAFPPPMNAHQTSTNHTGANDTTASKKDHQKKDANIAVVGLLSLGTGKDPNGNTESDKATGYHDDDTIPKDLRCVLQRRHDFGPYDPQYHSLLQSYSKEIASFAATGHRLGMTMLQEYSSLQERVVNPSVGEKRKRTIDVDQPVVSGGKKKKDGASKDTEGAKDDQLASKDTDSSAQSSNGVHNTKDNKNNISDKVNERKTEDSLESSQGRDSSVNSLTSLANAAAIMRNDEDSENKQDHIDQEKKMKIEKEASSKSGRTEQDATKCIVSNNSITTATTKPPGVAKMSCGLVSFVSPSILQNTNIIAAA